MGFRRERRGGEKRARAENSHENWQAFVNRGCEETREKSINNLNQSMYNELELQMATLNTTCEDKHKDDITRCI